MGELQKHTKLIEKLKGQSREEVYQRTITGLIQAIKNNELTIDDVLFYTTISRPQLLELLGDEYCKQANHENLETELEKLNAWDSSKKPQSN